MKTNLNESTKVITMSNFKNGVSANAQIPLTDPLRSEGAVINEDGHLAFLKTNLPVDKDLTPHSLLANLGGLNGFDDISSIRKLLVESVPELNALVSEQRTRDSPRQTYHLK